MTMPLDPETRMNLYRALFGPYCRTCGESYSDAGDGWDGECPSCADRTYLAEFPEDES